MLSGTKGTKKSPHHKVRALKTSVVLGGFEAPNYCWSAAWSPSAGA